MKKWLVFVLAVVLAMGVLVGCKSNEEKKDPELTPTAEPTLEPTKEPKATDVPAVGLEPNTVFDAYAEFDKESASGENGPWVYAFTSDAGKSFDLCTIMESDGTMFPWHPWKDNWTGVSTNPDTENYIELNTERKDGIYGALGFKAPADGSYGIAGSALNKFGQAADAVHCVVNGKELFAAEFGTSEEGAKLFPYTTVDLKAGDIVYFYAPSKDDNWLSAYIKVKVAYQPSEQPEIVVEPPVTPEATPEPIVVDFKVPEGAYDSVAEFDKESATGKSGPWLYSFTEDEGATFQPCNAFEPFDNLMAWHTNISEYTGTGINLDIPDRIELNADTKGGKYGALGFKAPKDGTYIITGVAGNRWDSQAADVLHARLNGEDVFTVEPGNSSVGDTSFPETKVTMKKDEIIYFYCPSTQEGGWVSAYIAVAVLPEK